MKTVIPIDIVALGEKDSFHLFISGLINNRHYDLLIDTGASHTIFDATLVPALSDNEIEDYKIESAGISAGELDTGLGRISEFRLGDLMLKDWTVVLIDLSHVNSLYGKFTDKRIAGLIGSDFLLKYLAVIDYKKRELVLRFSKKKSN